MEHTCDLIRGDKSKGDLVAGGEQDVFLAGSSTPASVFLPGATLIHIIFMDHTITNVQIVKYCTQCALEMIQSINVSNEIVVLSFNNLFTNPVRYGRAWSKAKGCSLFFARLNWDQIPPHY